MRRYFEEFIDYGKRRKYSTHTLYDYRYTIRELFTFIELNYPYIDSVKDINRDIILDYEKYLAVKTDGRGKPLSLNRRRRFLMNLKTFFTYLEKNEVIDKNPALTVALPRERRTVIKDVLTEEEMKVLLFSCRGKDIKGHRDRAILELLYSTGIRADELCNVEIRDIDTNEGTLFIRKGKWSSERLVPLGKMARFWVVRYIEKARPLIAVKDSPLVFLSMKGRKLQPQALLDIVKYWAGIAGVKKNISTHSFRHSCALHMLKGRADIRYIQLLLGHRRITTTERYLNVELTDLKEVHRRCHPRERKGRK